MHIGVAWSVDCPNWRCGRTASLVTTAPQTAECDNGSGCSGSTHGERGLQAAVPILSGRERLASRHDGLAQRHDVAFVQVDWRGLKFVIAALIKEVGLSLGHLLQGSRGT